jgi:hypothetical protein
MMVIEGLWVSIGKARTAEESWKATSTGAGGGASLACGT